jgi:dTDP-D-glucose 4,6-dehydratase
VKILVTGGAGFIGGALKRETKGYFKKQYAKKRLV